MLDTLVPPRHALGDVRRLAREAYGLTGSWTPLEGERDQNFKVVEKNGAVWVFKLCNPNESPDIVRCQAAALTHIALTDPALPVPRMRRANSGQATAEALLGGVAHHMMLLSYLPGEPASGREISTHGLCQLGALVARLGRSLRGFIDPAPALRTLVWDNRHVLSLAPDVNLLPENLQVRACRLLDRFATDTLPRLGCLRSQIIHGDVHPHNTLMDRDGTLTGIIDFGDMVHATLVQDVANAIADWLTPENDAEAVIFEIVRGYCSVTPLEEEELDLILDMTEIRLLMTPLIDAMKQARGFPVQGYLETFGDRCLPLLEAIEDKGRGRLNDLIRRAGSFPPKAAARQEPIADLVARRRRIMGSQTLLFYDPPLHAVRGEGVWLFDESNRRYLDCYNNVPHVGHCHPYVTEAIARQARRLNTNTRYLTDESLAYAERLTATMDESLSAIVFVNSGSEANDVAWRMAKAWTGNSGGLAMDFAYHGITQATDAFSPSNSPEIWRAPHIRLLSPPDDYRGAFRRGENDLAERYAALADEPIATLKGEGSGLAAAMIDGAFMTNGMLDVPSGYVRRILEKTHDAGGLYIADEVQAGFGRMGTAMWGHQHHGIVPDIVTIGKPAGNGYPIGVVVTRPEILECFTKRAPFFSTFGGNNVACAAGIAVLDVIRDEGLVENARTAGAYLLASLRGLMQRHPIIGDVRGVGLAIGVELVLDRDTKEPATLELKTLLNLLRNEGVLAGNEGKLGNILKIRPPIVFRKQHADIAVAALDRALTQLSGGKYSPETVVARPSIFGLASKKT